MSDTIDCPKCGAEHSPNGIHEDDEGEHICEKCSFSFTVSIDYSPEYHSQCAEHEWGEWLDMPKGRIRWCAICPVHQFVPNDPTNT